MKKALEEIIQQVSILICVCCSTFTYYFKYHPIFFNLYSRFLIYVISFYKQKEKA